MKVINRLILILTALILSACGGSSDDTFDDRFSPGGVTPTPELAPTPDVPGAGESPSPPGVEPTPEPSFGGDSDNAIVNSGPHDTRGADSGEELVLVYFDLDTNAALNLSAEQAAANSDWDLAFSLTDVLLNSQASEPVSAYFTNNNADFFNALGEPIPEKFYAATAESELSDLIDYLPPSTLTDNDFETDKRVLFIGDRFLNYDASDQIATAADDRFFVVQSDGHFSKIRAKQLTNVGETISDLSLGIAHQSADESEFAAEQELFIDAADCVSDIYIDFATASRVESSGDWDLRLPCFSVNGATGAAFAMNIAEDATAIDADAELAGIDINSLALYDFQGNSRLQRFFDQAPWYWYNLEEEHRIWSQFGVYLIKTAVATYSFQIISYYDASDNPGYMSFRYRRLDRSVLPSSASAPLR